MLIFWLTQLALPHHSSAKLAYIVLCTKEQINIANLDSPPPPSIDTTGLIGIAIILNNQF